MVLPFLLVVSLLGFAASCSRHRAAPVRVVWTERDLMLMKGKTRDEVRETLGTPNGFYTRNAEGRWHYSNLLLDSEGAGPPRLVWVVIYFSQFGEQRATIVEIHEHAKD